MTEVVFQISEGPMDSLKMALETQNSTSPNTLK